ncbi:MAG: immunoglobulin domain-containing protein, partial [Bacteroidales bacterium]|nr:immunoglobulin domain-containing protein [Bacteroidales bacterium]
MSCILLLSHFVSYGQCTNCGSNYPGGTFSPGDSWGNASTNNWAGEYFYLSLNTNYIYQFYTSASYDTQLTLYPSTTCGGGAYDLAYDDDGGSGTLSWINYSPGVTNARILISEWSCASNSTSTTVNYRRIAKTPILTGTTNICAGSSTTLSANIGATNDSYVDVQWGTYCGGTNVSSDASSVTVSPSTTTTYYCRPRAKNADGGGLVYGNCASITVVVDQPSNAGTMSVTNSVMCSGGSTTFSASGTIGFEQMQYQWNGTGSTWNNWGSTNPHSWSSSSTGSTLYVRSWAQNGVCPSVYSSPVSVSIVADPAITTQPVGGTICTGGSRTLSMAASGGTPSLTYQWYRNGSSISGATSTSYSATSAGNYYCIASASGSGCGSAQTNTVTVTVVADPAITSQPVGGTICTGGSRTLSMAASGGTPSLTYQWYKNGSSISGATSTSYSATSAGNYYCIASASGSGCGNAQTSTVTVTVVADPAITSQPAGGTICTGGSRTLSMAASGGTPSLTYQWYRNGSSISGAISTSYSATSAGNYYCIASASGSGCGNAQTSTVTVTVVADPAITSQPAG